MTSIGIQMIRNLDEHSRVLMQDTSQHQDDKGQLPQVVQVEEI